MFYMFSRFKRIYIKFEIYQKESLKNHDENEMESEL
jgi:hypothetical protein